MNDAKREFTAAEVKAGALVLASLVILAGFVAAIRGCNLGSAHTAHYVASFPDIGGLDVDADVRFGGVKAGKVVAVEPDPADRSLIRVTAEVDGDVPINRGSVASIGQISLTAEQHLEISTGSAGEALLEDGARVPARPGTGGFMDLPELEGVTARLERALDGVIALTGVERARQQGDAEVVDMAELTSLLKAALDEGTGTVREISSVIGDNREAIGQIVTRLAAIEKAAEDLLVELHAVVEENRQPLRAAVGNLERLTEQADRSVHELTASLEATVGSLEAAGGNASDLLDDQRPAIEEILRNLQEATRDLRELSRLLSEQPQALIRGAEPRGRASEETK